MTRLLVLGMLDAQPLSGYDIQQLLRLSDAERWGGVLIGSIYHALKKLEKEGHIEISSIEMTGHRAESRLQYHSQRPGIYEDAHVGIAADRGSGISHHFVLGPVLFSQGIRSGRGEVAREAKRISEKRAGVPLSSV